jgi:hypothetical protein
VSPAGRRDSVSPSTTCFSVDLVADVLLAIALTTRARLSDLARRTVRIGSGVDLDLAIVSPTFRRAHEWNLAKLEI